MIIELNGIAIEIIKKPIKNMNLRIYPPDGRVKVSVPLHYKEQLIRTFLHEKSAWIAEQQKRIQARPEASSDLIQTGSILPFKGQNHVLVIHEHHGPSHVTCHDGFITCYLPHKPSQQQINTLLDNWYRREMASMLGMIIPHWASIIHVNVADWGIKKMNTRWGSCNTRARRIWLNLSLIKKPSECLEYVVVHELVHLLEASHNSRFYKLMDQFMPHWREVDYLLEGKKTKK
jgi:predicted metal-dependent hydrolase